MKALFVVAFSLLFVSQSRAGDTFKIDSAQSRIGFGVHHFVGVTKGTFTQFQGTIDLDRDHPERSSVEARIQVKSIETGIRKRDDHLRGAEFFDAAKYPQITFKSRSVKQTGPQSADISGDLSMHGVTRPIILHVKLLTPIPEQSAPARSRWAVTTDPIKRRDFGLMFSQTAEALSGIGQEVTADIQIVAGP
jgi:polyisoprenoid-binding protein YceI